MIFHGASMSALGLRRDKAALSSGCKSHPSMQRYHLNQGYLRSGQPRVSHPIGPTIPHRKARYACAAPGSLPSHISSKKRSIDQPLENGAPKWGRIVLAGQSQGAGMAAFIAKRQAAARVILFSSPWDFVVSDGKARRLAAWISAPSKTPPERWFGAYQQPLADRMREIYRSANGDRWLLAIDSDTGRVFVRHEPNLPSGNQLKTVAQAVQQVAICRTMGSATVIAITKWSISSVRPTAHEVQSPWANGGVSLHEIKHDRFL
jgi:hypothetical protein